MLRGPPAAPRDVLLASQHADSVLGDRALREREPVVDPTRERERFGGIEQDVGILDSLHRHRGDGEVVGPLVARGRVLRGTQRVDAGLVGVTAVQVVPRPFAVGGARGRELPVDLDLLAR